MSPMRRTYLDTGLLIEAAAGKESLKIDFRESRVTLDFPGRATTPPSGAKTDRPLRKKCKSSDQ